MPDLSFQQSNFSAGEWSPNFRGRIDDKEYLAALSLCMNYIPNQEGSLSPRSGFKRIGLTRDGSPAKLISARFSNWLPLVTEHTAGNTRLWSNGLPILTAPLNGDAGEYAYMVSVSGNPPTFVVNDVRNAFGTVVPAEWSSGDRIIVRMTTAAELEVNGFLANREWILTIVSQSAGTIKLTDAVTGTPITGPLTVAAPNTYKFFRILDMVNPYSYIDDIRQVQFTGQPTNVGTVTNNGLGMNANAVLPEHRAVYLTIQNSPRSLVFNQTNAGWSWVTQKLVKEKFIDGPYFDSPSTTIPATVSGTTGTITLRLHGYNTGVIYRNAATTWNGTNYFVSLKTNNKGNALPTPPAANASWASMPKLWAGATTYFLGQPAFFNPYDTGTFVYTVYYSIQAGNTNHQPPNVTWWATTPATWDIAATYSSGAVARLTGVNYVSIQGANTGNSPDVSPTWWLPVNYEAALDDIQNQNTGWPSMTKFFNADLGTDSDDIPRLIRLKAAPEPWDTQFIYAANDLVNYNDNIYKSLINANTANIPDQTPTDWEIQTQTILWTWAEFASIIDSYTATITIKGADFPNANPVFEWRMGVFSETTGWPTCGTYHEGRLCLAGAQPNRFDFGRSNKGFDFSPTAPDGTVADNNAISYVLNAEEAETINSMTSITEGVILFTNKAEWLISASSLNDPLTPTSIQAHRTTKFSSAPAEVTHLPSAIAVVQNGGRRVLEYRTFIDLTSYQSRLNVVDLSRKCQHLTGDGVIQTDFQSLPQPVLWGVPGGIVSAIPQLAVCPIPTPGVQITHAGSIGTLFGIGYARTPDVTYQAPFSFEHGWSLNTGIQKNIGSIAVQKGTLSTAEYLYATILDEVSGLYYVEMMMPVAESTPLLDTYNNDGTVAKYGTLSSDYFVDSGITPAAAKIATNGLSVTFYGLHGHAGETVQFTCRGKYVGDYLIAADGSVSVTFNTAFAKTDLGRAMYVTAYNATLYPPVFQQFFLDKNGNTGVDEPSTTSDWFFGQFGYKYRRRGQTLRPSNPGANGPSFAKIKRNERMGVYVDNGQEISIGDTFTTLHALTLQVPRTDGKVSAADVTINDFVTGIFRDEMEQDYTFDGGLCWEQTRPVRGSILAVGGFEDISDQ